MAKHFSAEAREARRERRGWSRRRKLAAIGGVTAAAVAGFAVAWAIINLKADINGSGNISAPADVEFVAANIGTETNADCTANLAGGVLTVDVASGVTGGFCDVMMTVRRTGVETPPAVVTDIKYAAPVTEKFRAGDCGVAIPATPAGVQVVARFTLGTPGAFTAQADAGLYASDVVNASCPTL